MIYADTEFYKDKYLLGRKPVIGAGFDFYARQASVIMDGYTFGRLNSTAESAMLEAVRMCCCELAEQCFREEKRENGSDGKTSEKNGTYAVTFASSTESAQTAATKEHDIVMKWLADTRLCYQGV